MIDVTAQVEAQNQQIQFDRELRKKESELAHVARLSMMGEMVAGISHEINQPLSAISNLADAAFNTLQNPDIVSDSPMEAWMQQIAGQAVRCGDIIRRLRGITRKNGVEHSRVSLSEAVNDSIGVLSEPIREHSCNVDVDVPDDLIVCASDVEIQQVLVNLIRNACDATEGSTGPSHIRIKAVRDSDTICLSIEDNGNGISAEHASTIFDAFFTTRKDGMGMGLAISRSIMRNHGGRLWVDSEYAEGARFCLEFPLDELSTGSIDE